jgi:hypothetical protein
MRSAGHWKRKARMRKGASAEGLSTRLIGGSPARRGARDARASALRWRGSRRAR